MFRAAAAVPAGGALLPCDPADVAPRSAGCRARGKPAMLTLIGGSS